jgi:endonuclease/exonuclease/phosphatase family metal-dependent hydrolase
LRDNTRVRHHPVVRLVPILALLGAALAGCQSGSHGAAPAPGAAAAASTDAPAGGALAKAPGSLRIATWNLQWLLAPESAAALLRDCVPEQASPGPRRRYIPCNAAEAADRSLQDYEALARYARRLDADVVALQEVDGEAAARRLFPRHRFCFTGRVNVQNTGFAIRPGIPFRCEPDLVELQLEGSLRRGAQVTIHPGGPGELRLLAVHLKSGCNNRPLDDPREQCQALARQVPILERWIDEQAAAGRRFAVLGDFNRRLQQERGPARNAEGATRNLWAEIDDADPPEADLTDAAEGSPFVNCTPLQRFDSYIDHILLSKSLAERRVPGPLGRVTYEPAEATRRQLSDHCPVFVDLALRH